jgi:NAD(P)H-nitrite reductase large subunit
MKDQHMHHIIIGAGPAGVIAAETIRKHAPSDQITLIGEEKEAPYSRMAIPYLLVGNVGEQGTHLRKSATHFKDLNINLVQAQVKSAQAATKTLALSNGQSMTYDRLLIATGSTPMRPPIPGIDSPNIYSCWTLADARAIMDKVKPGSRVLQMGAGFIGCIIMESIAARIETHKSGKLSVVEMGDRMVPRMMGPAAGGMIKTWCQSKGVDVFTGAKVESITVGGGKAGASSAVGGASATSAHASTTSASTAGMTPMPPAAPTGLFGKIANALGFGSSSSGDATGSNAGHATASSATSSASASSTPNDSASTTTTSSSSGAPLLTKLSTGQTIEADVIISATGVKPTIGFLQGSGIKTNIGILTDDRMQTSMAGVYAAGDCAEAFDNFTGTSVVSAIQPNAADQARIAALNMVGQNASLRQVTQINVLDTLGLVSTSFGSWQGVPGSDQIELRDDKGYKLLSMQFKDDVMVGCNSIGWTDHIGALRGLVEGKVKLGEWKAKLKADPTQLMAAYLATAQAQGQWSGATDARRRAT